MSPNTFISFTDGLTLSVNEVTDDAWNYGVSVDSGFISVGNGSPFVAAFEDPLDAGKASFFVESGPVVDQTNVGGNVASTTATVKVGGTDYALIYNLNALEEANAISNAEGLFPLASVGFGKATFDIVASPPVPTQAYYEALGYPGQAQAAIITPGFKGIGLPSYLWSQLVNLFYKVDATIAAELQCEQAIGGVCRLQ